MVSIPSITKRLLGDIPLTDAYDKNNTDDKDDLLNFLPTAKVLADAVLETPDPLTIGIFGEWGSGKTSLMSLIKRQIEKNTTDKNNVTAIWFNAWQYEKEEHLIIPLIRMVKKELESKSIKNIASTDLIHALQALIYGLTIKVAIPGFLDVSHSTEKMIDRQKELDEKNILPSSFYFYAIEKLKEVTIGNNQPRIVIFLDDLDRCFPNKAVELLEAIKLVLNLPGFAFILGVNEKVIQEFIIKKYAKDFRIQESHFSDYLDKIVQVQVSIPEQNITSLEKFIKNKLQYDFTLKKHSDDLFPLLAEACQANPRKIIRMLNRVMVISRINSKQYMDIDPLALIIYFTAGKELFQLLDRSITVNKTSKKIGDTLAGLMKTNKGIEQLKKALNNDNTIESSDKDILSEAISILNMKPHLLQILKTMQGYGLLEDSDYRRRLVNAAKATEESKGQQFDKPKKKTNLEAELKKVIQTLTHDMIPIESGNFLMGSSDDDRQALKSEKPRHRVLLEAYSICRYLVTQEQFEAVMGNNPSSFCEPNNPVERVTFYEAKKFCDILSKNSELIFKLPSEAQWEYACRAENDKPYYFMGNSQDSLDNHAYYIENSEGHVHNVGELKPNNFQLHDMYGNVWEWCEDSWHDNYENAPIDGSAWEPDKGQRHVIRGGGWNSEAKYCRSAERSWEVSTQRNNQLGFRVIVLPLEVK